MTGAVRHKNRPAHELRRITNLSCNAKTYDHMRSSLSRIDLFFSCSFVILLAGACTLSKNSHRISRNFCSVAGLVGCLYVS
jgi:hypothetical protein